MPDGTSVALIFNEDDGVMRRGDNITTTLKFRANDIFEAEDPVGIVIQRTWTIRRDIEKLPKHIEELWKSNTDVLKTLLPGIKLRRKSTTHVVPIIIISAVLWLIFYFTELYRDDHQEHISPEWKPEDEGLVFATPAPPHAVQPQAAPRALDCAELVLVFHHPDSEYAGHSQQVPVTVLKDMLLYNKARPTEDVEHVRERFCNFKEFLESGTGESDSDLESSGSPEASFTQNATMAGHRAMRSMKRTTSKAREVMNAAIGLTRGKTMIEARVALLQDVVECLPTLMGFDVSIFSSVGNDELFLAISLNRKQWISYYLTETRLPLQITHSVVKALGVGQDPGDPNSSPPYVQYNQDMAKSLYRKGITAAEDDRLLYRTWYDRDPNGSVMSSKMRVHFILRELQGCLDLDVAKEIGMLAQWYPAHSEMTIKMLREIWADRWSDLHFVQPVILLKQYFGSQVAFNFAWQGLYCKGLIALSVVAVVVEMLKIFPPILVGVELINSRVLLPFSIVIAIWARIMANLWEREETYFTHQWDMHVGKISRFQRPSFRGELCMSDVDNNLTDDRMPPGPAARRRLCSLCITLTCCCFVMCAISLWIYSHDGEMDLVSSLTLSLFIKIFELCYNAISAKLAQYENHKYEDSFHNSVVWHQFIFQAINSYWAIVSIAINLQWSGRCVKSLCLTSLKIQTTMLMLILLSCSMAFSAIELVLVRVSLELENRKLKRRLGKDVAQKRTAQRSFLEEQAKYNKFETREQIENTLQLVLALGYVLLFGTLQPLVVPLCLVHFAFTLRVRAALLTRYAQRCVPHELVGIGAWKPAVSILMNVGVFSSAFLLVYWGRFFKGGALVAKLTGMIMWFVTVCCLWFVVDVFVPATSSDMDVLERRRRYVERIMTEASMHKHLDPPLSARSSLLESASSDQTMDHQWSSSMASVYDQLIRQRTFRLSQTRLLGQSTGGEDVAPDDAKCAVCVATKQWSSLPMFDGKIKRMTSSDDPEEEA